MCVLVRVYVRRRREVMMKRRKEKKGASLFFRCSEQRLCLDWAEGRKENMTEGRREGQEGAERGARKIYIRHINIVCWHPDWLEWVLHGCRPPFHK